MVQKVIVRIGLLVMALLSGCGTYLKHTDTVRNGPGLEFKQLEVAASTDNQDKLLTEFKKQAEITSEPLTEKEWSKIIQVGMNYADQRCDEYIHALFRLDRDRKTATAEIGLLGTATAGLMAAAVASARSVAAVAIGFGLASSTTDTLASNLLFDLDPSSVSTLVRSLQVSYRGVIEDVYLNP